MEPVSKITGKVAILDRNNVDTDAIIPKQFMKSIGRTGFGPYAFDSWRYMDEGYWGQDCSKRQLNKDFELNQPRYANSSILVSGKNFGCGSSREHAPWALSDYGFKAILAESFADIFKGNALKNGLLVVELTADSLSRIREYVAANVGCSGQIDLATQNIAIGGLRFHFDFDASWKERLLNGMDDISLTLQDATSIHEFERSQRASQPWLYR